MKEIKIGKREKKNNEGVDRSMHRQRNPLDTAKASSCQIESRSTSPDRVIFIDTRHDFPPSFLSFRADIASNFYPSLRFPSRFSLLSFGEHFNRISRQITWSFFFLYWLVFFFSSFVSHQFSESIVVDKHTCSIVRVQPSPIAH